MVMPDSLSAEDLRIGFRRLGVKEGDALEVHVSLSSFGHVVGGARTIIQSLIDVVGQGGAIVMSCYPVSPPVSLTDADRKRGISWKVRILDAGSTERLGTGAVADEFSKCSGTVCGEGIHRICARGKDAEKYTMGYENLVDSGGKALLLGVGIDRCSSLHIAEDVPLPKEIQERFEIPKDVIRDYPVDKWSVGFGEELGSPFEVVFRLAQDKGLVMEGMIGDARCYLFALLPLVGLYRTLRRERPYELFEKYARPVHPWERCSNRDVQKSLVGTTIF